MRRPLLHPFSSVSLASAILALALPAVSTAQAPQPTWLRFYTATIKPHTVTEFEGYMKQISAAYRKAGEPAFVVLSNVSGNRYEYTIVTFVNKFAELNAPSPLQKIMGNEAFGNLMRALEHCHESLNVTYSQVWHDVKIDKPGPKRGYILRQRHFIANGKNPEFRAFIKNDLRPVLEKGGVNWFHVSAPTFGGVPGTVEVVRALNGIEEIDSGPILTRLLGADGSRAMLAKQRALTRGPSQTTILRVRPELSLLPAAPAAR